MTDSVKPLAERASPMKDTLRKKFVKAPTDEASVSSESPSANPWASENSKESSDTITRQLSSLSQNSDNAPKSPTPGIGEVSNDNGPNASQQEVRVDPPDGSKAARRKKKTITKTPHTFELQDDLKVVKTTPTKVSEPPIKNGQLSPDAKATSFSPSEIRPRAASSAASKVSTVFDETSPKRVSAPPVNPFTIPSDRHKSARHVSSGISNPCRFTPPTTEGDKFFNKVIVLTHGASPVGQTLVRQFHTAGARVIFGDPNPDRAKRLIRSLGPPDIINFNLCDVRKYDDILDLFKLAVNMYGRVDHAIYGVSDDGGQAGPVGEGEKGWFDFANKTTKGVIEEVQTEHQGADELLTASIKFARISLAYLRHYASQARSSSQRLAKNGGRPPANTDCKSLTFITSVAAFKEMPGLPLYQVSQHTIFALVRSLRSTVDPDVDGVRINALATNMMIARTVAQSEGRMSVSIPPDNPEDVGRFVAGVVAATPTSSDEYTGTGIWYEDKTERLSGKFLHGRLFYMVAGQCWDVQEGLDRSEIVWLGQKPAEALNNELDGVGNGKQWILDSL